MKYIKIFENFNKDKEKIFEDQKWLVIKIKSYESLLSYSEGTEWHIKNVNSWSGYSTEKYRFNDKIYINIDKQKNVKYLFDFDTEKFYDNENNDLYLNEFFDKNSDLMNIYGEIINCSNIVKDNGEYWIVIGDYDYFEPYFTVSRDVRADYIKNILSRDYLCEYDPSDFKFDEDVIVTDDNIQLLKMILRLEKIYNDYKYDLNDIKDYNNITEIIKEYGLDELKRILRLSICESNENADVDEVYDQTIIKIYNFFGLINGSADWKSNNNLWIKFDSNKSAYKAKLIITNFNNSYEDEKIDGNPPYNGYNANYQDICAQFNSILIDRLYDYRSDNLDSETIFKYFDKLDSKENISEDDIIKEIELLINSEKYNL